MLKWPLHFIDVETSHLDPRIGEILELCIISESRGGRQKEFLSKFRPLHIDTANPKSLEINGYDPDDWEGAPLFIDRASQIRKILSTGTVIGHNVAFDRAWLNYHLELSGERKISHRSLCTQSLAIEHLPIPSSSLNKCREFFGLSKDRAHSAKWDVLHCQIIFWRMYRSTTLDRLIWRLRWALR